MIGLISIVDLLVGYFLFALVTLVVFGLAATVLYYLWLALTTTSVFVRPPRKVKRNDTDSNGLRDAKVR